MRKKQEQVLSKKKLLFSEIKWVESMSNQIYLKVVSYHTQTNPTKIFLVLENLAKSIVNFVEHVGRQKWNFINYDEF